MIDYSYDKIVIVCYPPLAGGKFLINNLGLNNQAVFRDSVLAQRQIKGDFSYEDKLAYISTQLEDTVKNSEWNDLNLGCSQLFGSNAHHYLHLESIYFLPIVQTIISKNLFLFYDTTELVRELDLWKNAKVIGFTNFKNFIKERKYKSKQDEFEKLRSNYWNVIKGESWPEQPPKSESDFALLHDSVQSELINNFENLIFKWFDPNDRWVKWFEDKLTGIKEELGSRFYQIDVDEFYKDEQTFLSTLKDCLQWLDLPVPRNDRDNSQYFHQWKTTLDLINTSDQGN